MTAPAMDPSSSAIHSICGDRSPRNRAGRERGIPIRSGRSRLDSASDSWPCAASAEGRTMRRAVRAAARPSFGLRFAASAACCDSNGVTAPSTDWASASGWYATKTATTARRTGDAMRRRQKNSPWSVVVTRIPSLRKRSAGSGLAARAGIVVRCPRPGMTGLDRVTGIGPASNLIHCRCLRPNFECSKHQPFRPGADGTVLGTLRNRHRVDPGEERPALMRSVQAFMRRHVSVQFASSSMQRAE